MRYRSIVVVCILLVSVAAGCISDDNPKIKDEVVEVDLDVQAMTVNDVSYWDMQLEVDDQLGKALKEVQWSQVSVKVEGADGSEIIPSTVPEPLPGTRPETKGVYYVSGPQAEDVAIGDLIVITGVDSSFEDCVLRIYREDKLVAKSMPAPDLPQLSLAIQLGEPSIEEHSVNESHWWDVTVPISKVTPAGAVVNWSDATSAKLVDPGTNQTLFESNMSQSPGDAGKRIDAYDADGDGDIDGGDSLNITSIPIAYEGAVLQLLVNWSVVGSRALPDEFPVSDPRGSFDISIGEYKVKNEAYWFMNISDISMRVPGIVPRWDDIGLRMVSGEPDPGKVFINRTNVTEYAGTTNATFKAGYLEYGGTAGSVDRDDMILVSGMNLSFSNASVELLWRGDVVGTAWLPHNLNFTDYANTTINLAYPSVEQVVVGNTTVYYVILNINKITPKDIEVSWEHVRLTAKSSTGSVIMPSTPVQEDILPDPAYDNDDSDGIDIELWYVETGGDARMGAGDAIKITGLPRYYEGATIQLLLQGYVVGSVTLPTYFP